MKSMKSIKCLNCVHAVQRGNSLYCMANRPDIGGWFIGKAIENKLYIQTPAKPNGTERKNTPSWCKNYKEITK